MTMRWSGLLFLRLHGEKQCICVGVGMMIAMIHDECNEMKGIVPLQTRLLLVYFAVRLL